MVNLRFQAASGTGAQRQCFEKCPFACQFDWLSDQLCQSLDRLFDHFAKHCPQVKALCTLPSGGVPATYLSSAQSKDDTNAVYSELRKAVPSCKLLYVTPEQLCKNGMLQELLAGLHSRGKLARLVIDEVRHSSGFTLSGFMGLPTAKP